MTIDILSAFSEMPPEVDYVLPNVVAGTVCSLVSPGGAGKSMLALQLASQIAGGPDLLGINSFAIGKVVYLPAEDPPIAIMHRLYALGSYFNEDERINVSEHLHIEPLIGRSPNLMSIAWVDALKRISDGKSLLVLDTLRRFHVEDENSSGAMSSVIGVLESIASETGCTIMFLHHLNKSAAFTGMGDAPQASRGASVLVDNIRCQAFLSNMTSAEAKEWGICDHQRRSYVRFGINKANYGTPYPDCWFKRHGGGVLKLEPLRRKSKRQAPVSKVMVRSEDDNW